MDIYTATEQAYKKGYEDAIKHSKWDTVFYQRHSDTLATYTHLCPECKYLYQDLRLKGYNFCPQCGVKMDL